MLILAVSLTLRRVLSDRISPPARRVFVALALAETASVGELARATEVSDSVASRAITVLTRADLVESRVDPQNRRRRIQVLTPHGEKVADRLRVEVVSVFARVRIFEGDRQVIKPF
jgi:DNA-binding MarR family transcriptional regulator